MQLLWKQYKETNYEISMFGTVRNILTKQVLKPQKHYKGHLKVRLYFEFRGKKKFKNYFIHRLVANCWLNKKRNKPVVDHFDCDKTNNYYTNLEYVTQQENTQRAFNNGLIDMEYMRSFRKKAA
jgi:hypothetical protein